jgi:hypothetical protein
MKKCLALNVVEGDISMICLLSLVSRLSSLV